MSLNNMDRNPEMIKQVLGQDDELVLDNPKDITIPGLDIRRSEDKIVALGLWDDGTYTALVSENRLYALYLAFDEISDPMGLQSIRVSLAEDDHAERLYVDTADKPMFGANFQRTELAAELAAEKRAELKAIYAAEFQDCAKAAVTEGSLEQNE